MTNLLLSKFETYLLDENVELEHQEVEKEHGYTEPSNYEEYPPGFFSSL
ncbi:MAG TPA: hypothetical protein VNS08_10835 [Ureibacillus sp.]|nr:hypothetical protein [Ureibacillus sp.]